MSAPTTPAEMADWLEQVHAQFSYSHKHFAYPGFLEAAKMLRAVPTDAQKIKALKLAAGCGWLAGLFQDEWGDNVLPSPSTVTDMASDARKALRLLGLPTE